jgi:hypothetical protein
MKKVLVMLSLFAAVLLAGHVKAQVNVNVNIGSQPEWGPSGYNHVDYYYLPDINAYYNISTAQYIYLLNNKWHFAKKLPSRYKNYNVYNAYKVDVNREKPYQNNKQDIQNYGKYKGQTGQQMLRDNQDYKNIKNQGNSKSGKSNKKTKEPSEKKTNSRQGQNKSDKAGH